MLPKLTIIPLLCALLIVTGPDLGKALAAEPQTNDEESELLAKDLAAFQALRDLLGSRRHVLNQQQVEAMVGQYLRNSKKEPPHKFPADSELQEPLDSDFDAFYKALIGKATAKLDPKGKLGLENRLRDYSTQKELDKKARERYQKYLANNLKTILATARAAIKNQQVAQLIEALKAHMALGKPGVNEIESAFQDDSKASALVENIKGQVLKNVDAELSRILLIDADEELARNVGSVVSNGINQLKLQLNELKKGPQSHTLHGITNELQVRLDSFVERQSKPVEPGPLWKHYGTFPLANTAVGKQAEGYFGNLVAEAAKRVMASVEDGSQPLPEEHEKDIQQTIRDDMPRHHEFKESKSRLQPKIDGWVEEDQQQWTAQDLLQAARNTRSKHDEPFSPQGFRDDIQGVSRSLKPTDTTDLGKSWMALKSGLAIQYAEELLPEVRAGIAKEDAQRYSPLLMDDKMDGKWKARQEDIDSFTSLKSQVSRGLLQNLQVWDSKPSDPKAVLEETWQQWSERAQRELVIGRTALDGQRDVVIEVSPQMANLIRKNPTADVADWKEKYVSLVLTNWKQEPADAARHYPELFQHTYDRIDSEVQKLLDLVAKERKTEEEERAAKAREMIESPETVDEGQEETEKPPSGPGEEGKGPAPSETDESKQGDQSTTGDGKTGDGDMSPDGDGQSKGSTTDGAGNDGQKPSEGEAEEIDEKKRALFLQNEIVDRLKPDIAVEIAIARVTEGNLERSHWIETYNRRATGEWRKEELSEKFPDLFPPVVERIEGLVDILLMPFRSSVRGRVLELQLAIVEEHRFGRNGKDSIVRMIESDPDATQVKYETLFLERVLSQWQDDASEEVIQLRRQYPGLLDEVKDLIHVIVAYSIFGKSGGNGGGPTGFWLQFYCIGFWSLLFLVIVMSGCWYWNVRYLRAYIAARRLAD